MKNEFIKDQLWNAAWRASTQRANIYTQNKNQDTLKQFRKDFDKASILKDYDRHNLLDNVRDIKSVDDILENDVLGLLEKLYLQNDYNLHVICEKLKRKGIVVNSVCFVTNEHTNVNAIMEDIMLYQNGILTTATNGVFLIINEYDSEIRRKILSFLLK